MEELVSPSPGHHPFVPQIESVHLDKGLDLQASRLPALHLQQARWMVSLIDDVPSSIRARAISWSSISTVVFLIVFLSWR